MVNVAANRHKNSAAALRVSVVYNASSSALSPPCVLPSSRPLSSWALVALSVRCGWCDDRREQDWNNNCKPSWLCNLSVSDDQTTQRRRHLPTQGVMVVPHVSFKSQIPLRYLGHRQVRSWSQTCSELEFGRSS